ELRQITTNPANDFAPVWSRDGQEIAFASDRETGRGIYSIAVAGAPNGAERLVQEAAGALAGPSWSPDGRTIAFNSISPPKSSLMIGGTNIADPDEDVFPFRPQWTSTGDVLYTADGKIKRRPAAGRPAAIIELSAEVSFERPAFT